MFGNVRLAFGTILKNLQKSSQSGRKSPENHQKRYTLHEDMNFMFSWQELYILSLPLEHKIHIFSPPRNILYYLHRENQTSSSPCLKYFMIMQSPHECRLTFDLRQEIIKVREWIPHVGPLTKVIPLKLFLDIVPSSSEDITHTMRGQPKRLPRITWEKWRERHFISFGFVSYRRCFLHSQLPFCAVGHLVCFPARLAVHYFAVCLVLGSYIKQTSTATAMSAMAV